LKPFINISKTYDKFERYLSASANDKNAPYCNFHSAKNNKLYIDQAVYGLGVRMKFENLEVIVPEKYDEYLTAYYCDWRADLPEEQKVGHHYYEILDLNRPYSDYIKNVSKNKRKIKLK
jgi:lipopolysaccharide cholinephosphotransferase